MDCLSPSTSTVQNLGIPVLDLGACRRSAPGARERAGRALAGALERVGFFYLTGHGVRRTVIDRASAEARRFHALPLAEKLKVSVNRSGNGYLPLQGHTQRHAGLEADPKPNQNESFFARRERDPQDPDVLAGRDLRDPNRWPENLPGFREALLEYQSAMGQLARFLLPLYARALDLPADYFRPFFHKGGELTVRLIHYPSATAEQIAGGVFGTAAHTDRSMFTILAQEDAPGLEILLPHGEWTAAPVVAGAFVVNAGDTLRRWSNDRFLSTRHRVLNVSGRSRHSVACFVAPEFDTVIECLPSCVGLGRKHGPITMERFMIEFFDRNYAHRQSYQQPGAD